MSDFVCRCSTKYVLATAARSKVLSLLELDKNWGADGDRACHTPRVHNASEATHMKTLKTVGAVAAALLLTALTIGANTGGSAARPTNVPSERWIAISPNAGFA